jgi:hypothetical protein
LLLGAFCVGAPLCFPNLAIGQTATVQPEPSAGTAAEAPGASDEIKREMAELSAQLAQQRAESASQREELQRKFDEERSAREAAEAQILSKAKAEVESAIKANPRVGGIEGLSLSGFVQADFTVKQTSEDQLNPSSGAPLNENRFFIRRARLRTAVEQQYLAGVLELDANTVNGAQVRPVNVEATLKWPGGPVPLVALTVGLFKIPFGHEVLQSDRDRLFVERSSFVRALFPGEYDLGARLAGGWRFVRYALAVQNGEPLGTSTFPMRDPNQAKDITGRLGIAAQVSETVAVQAGFSGLTGKGFHKGVLPTKPTVTWQDLNEDGRYTAGELAVSPGTSGQPSRNFSRYAVGGDAQVSLKYSRRTSTTLYAEIALANNLDRAILVADPYGQLDRPAREWGYYVAAVQDIGTHFKLGLRYDYYNPDRDSTDTQAAVKLLSSQAISTVSAAVALVGKVGALSGRFVAEYDVVSDHQGRNATGMPTDLKNNVFTLRTEVAF